MFLFLILISITKALASPVSIDEALKTALSRNETDLQAKEQVTQSEARTAQLRGGVFPNIGFNLLYQLQAEPSDPVARSFSPGQQTTVSFYVSQPLFKGLREFNGLSQMGHLEAREKANAEMVKTNTYFDVATTYLQILSLEQDLVNLKEQSELYQKRIKDLEARTQRGESNETDFLTAQSTYASLVAEIHLTESNHLTEREKFQYLTGLPANSTLTDPKIASTVQPLEKYTENIEKRPDVKYAREQAEAFRKGLAVAWGAHFPTLDLVGNYYVVRPGFLSDLKWDVGFRLTMPIFEGFGTQAKIWEASSRKREADITLTRTRRAANQEIRSLHEKLKARLDHLASLKKSAELSRKNTTVMQRYYKRGLIRNIDLQVALTEFRNSQRGYDKAYFLAQLEKIQLQLAAAMIPAIAKEN